MTIYFDDLNFISGGIVPLCTARVDCSFPGMFNLQFVLKGSIYLSVDDGDEMILRSPVFFWHSPEHSYRYGPAEGDSWHHFWVTFKGKRAERMMRHGVMPLVPKTYLPILSPLEFSIVFTELIQLVRSDGVDAHPKAVAKLEYLLALLWDEKDKAKEIAKDFNEKLIGLTEKIRQAPKHDYDFKNIAESLNLSYSYFRDLFKRHTGMPPHEFLLSSRMRMAAESLCQEKKPVKVIAYEFGYNDPSQFCKLFKKKIGVSPENYRKMHVGLY